MIAVGWMPTGLSGAKNFCRHFMNDNLGLGTVKMQFRISFFSRFGRSSRHRTIPPRERAIAASAFSPVCVQKVMWLPAPCQGRPGFDRRTRFPEIRKGFIKSFQLSYGMAEDDDSPMDGFLLSWKLG
jgi:hypothetical protein